MDVYSKEKRSEIMSKVRGKDTGPEMIVRRLVHGMGYRYRLHVGNLPGRPDIVFPSQRKAIFVNGCFWHGHSRCKRSKKPADNAEFWSRKIERNMLRDRKAKARLKKIGWKVLIVWECQIKKTDAFIETLDCFLRVTA